MEENKLNIYQKLLAIQKQVKGLSKDKKSHNYDYVTGNKLLSFIKPLMDEQGLILKQEVLEIENTRQDYQVWDKWMVNSDGNKGAWKPKNEILSKVMMRFTWIDCETGDKDENLFGANGQNDWEKGLGSALTYAERYFLLKFFHIATDEDDIDNPERKGGQVGTQEPPKPKNKTEKKSPEEALKVYLIKQGALTDGAKSQLSKAINAWGIDKVKEVVGASGLKTITDKDIDGLVG